MGDEKQLKLLHISIVIGKSSSESLRNMYEDWCLGLPGEGETKDSVRSGNIFSSSQFLDCFLALVGVKY